MSFRSALSSVLSSTVAVSAEQAGPCAKFPRQSVAALGEAGLLGLTAGAEFGGAGLGLAEAAEVVTQVSRVCPATGAVLRSHYAAVAFIEAYGGTWIRREVAGGHHLSTLALDNADGDGPGGGAGPGAPFLNGGATHRAGGVVALHARKRDVVGAGEADSYVWSSGPAGAGDTGHSLWLVPADAPGLHVPARPTGRGPHGSRTATVCADPVLIPADAMLVHDDGGPDGMLATVRAWLAALPEPLGPDGPKEPAVSAASGDTGRPLAEAVG